MSVLATEIQKISSGRVPWDFDHDFTSGSLPSGRYTTTFSRASSGVVQDHQGILHYAKAGEARFSGLRRVENHLANSIGAGGTVGVVGSGGVLPTNWALNAAGLTVEILGLQPLRVRVYGTVATANLFTIRPMRSIDLRASFRQRWLGSMRVRLISGTIFPLAIQMSGRTAAGASIQGSMTVFVPDGNNATRVAAPFLSTVSTIVRLDFDMRSRTSLTVGNTWDFTLEFDQPML